MCGIAGIVSSREIPLQDIQSVTNAIRHRGPDAQEFYSDRQVALGHNRLSIIDLDARSNQPFYSSCGRYVMVYNGEIYNYRLLTRELISAGVPIRTSSDTEVIMLAFITWGIGFVHKLNGMFAFAIYDTVTGKLYLYRDRVGKKPLYYYQAEGLFVFASELKAILHHPQVKRTLKVRHASLSCFLQLGYIQQPDTFFEQVYKFPAGHYAIVSLQSLSDFRPLPYWDVAHYIRTDRHVRETTALHQLRCLLHEAVTDRLVADVPVGVFLSGGIDSSLVTAIASKTQKLKTFSIGFKEQEFDESVYAQQVARHLGTEHFHFLLRQQQAVDLVEKYLEHFDEPFADTSAIPTMLVSQLAREQIKVALTGDGGDELFMGYGAYTWANRLTNPAVSALRPLIHTIMRAIPANRWQRAAHLFEKVRPGKLRRHIFSQEQYFFSDPEVYNQLLSDKLYYYDWPYDDFRYLKTLSEAERQALFDFQYYLRDDLLVKVDRASMLYGLECRCPLLDHRLVQFAVNLPESFKKRQGITKYLLKQILFEMVPSHYFARPKWGFSVPLAQWLLGDLGYLMDYISDEKIEATAVFNLQYVQELKRRFYAGHSYLYNRLWVIMIVQKYLLKLK